MKISAKSGEGLHELLEQIDQKLFPALVEANIHVSYDRFSAIGNIYKNSTVLNTCDDEKGRMITVRISVNELLKLKKLFPDIMVVGNEEE